MVTKKKVKVKYKICKILPSLKDMENNVVYISKKYLSTSHKCICGCGIQIHMGLMPNEWKYQIDSNNKISMQPSVGNYQIPCKSHYIFYKGNANFV